MEVYDPFSAGVFFVPFHANYPEEGHDVWEPFTAGDRRCRIHFMSFRTVWPERYVPSWVAWDVSGDKDMISTSDTEGVMRGAERIDRFLIDPVRQRNSIDGSALIQISSSILQLEIFS